MIPGFPGALRIYGVMLLCASTVCQGAPPAPAPDWTGSFLARVETLAVLQTFNAELLSHDSATLTLERWCDVHRLASPPRIVASRVRDIDKPPTPEQRRELGVAATDAVRYRRVRLMCGTLVLSEADNWYVPGRLTPEMNQLLDTTDSPFGVVVRVASLPTSHAVLDAAMAAVARGMGNGCGEPAQRGRESTHACPAVGASGSADPAGRHAVQRGGRNLHGQGAGVSDDAVVPGRSRRPRGRIRREAADTPAAGRVS